jgi:WD40 repeat protein
MTAGVLAIFSLATLCQSPRFVPVHIHRIESHSANGVSTPIAVATMYPMRGPSTNIELPGVSPNVFTARSTADGRTIYAANATPKSGVTKIEFNPLRVSTVEGSREFIILRDVRVLSRGKIGGIASTRSEGRLRFGAYSLDPVELIYLQDLEQTGRLIDISPDMKRASIVSGDGRIRPLEIRVLDLESSGQSVIKGVRGGYWSPDGRWMAVIRDGRLELLDAATLQRKRELGSVEMMGVWSPDSRYLLFFKSQFSCAATLYGRSLEVLNVESGKRITIASSHCDVVAGALTWLDASILTPRN